jgi:hypothetical protein
MHKAVRDLSILSHSHHAEWGHGIITDETPDKVYLYFEHGGTRTFVNAPRYREQLVGVELSLPEATALRRALEQQLSRPTRVAGRKKTSSSSQETSKAGHGQQPVAP